MTTFTDDLKYEYEREIRRCWDTIALLLQTTPADIAPFIAERERLMESLDTLAGLTECRGVGIVVLRGLGATVVHSDPTTAVPEIRELGPDSKRDLEALATWGQQAQGRATTIDDLNAIPVWGKLISNRGRALVIARPPLGFFPLLSIACWRALTPQFTAVAVRSVERETQDLLDMLRGTRLDAQATAAQHHVASALGILQMFLEDASAAPSDVSDGRRQENLQRLGAVIEVLYQQKGTLDLLVDYVTDNLRPPHLANYVNIAASDLVSAALDRSRPALEQAGIQIDPWLPSHALLYVLPTLFNEAIATILEVPRLHAGASRVTLQARDLAHWMEIEISWDGTSIPLEHVRAVNDPSLGFDPQWGDTQLLLQARQKISALCGRMKVESHPRSGTTVYLQLVASSDQSRPEAPQGR